MRFFLSLLRFNAILPLGMILFILVIYIHFFLDWHLRFVVERMGTYLVGAEVDVGHLRTRFLQSSLKVQSFTITNPHRPTYNWVEFKTFHIRFSWDGLLRGKVVIPLWEIGGLAFNKVRSQPGKVPKNSLVSFLSRSGKALSKKVDHQLKKNPRQNQSSLGDVFSLIQGEDIFKKIAPQLVSKKKIETLEKDISQLDKKWKERIHKLPKESEIKQLYKEAKSISFSNLLQLPQSISRLEKVLKKGKEKYRLITDAQKHLREDLSRAHKDVTQVTQWVEEDLKILKKRWQFPRWSAKHLSQQMLMTYLEPYKTKYLPYYKKLQPYFPPLFHKEKMKEKGEAHRKTNEADAKDSEKGNKSNPPSPRTYPISRGTLYEFGRVRAYPLLWIQNLRLGLDRGDVLKGKIHHISSDFRALGEPVTLNLKGEGLSFPVKSFHWDLAFDPKGESYHSKGSLNIADWQMGEQTLFSSRDFKLGWKKARSRLRLNFMVLGSTLNFQGKQTFRSVDYHVNAQDPFLRDFLLSTLKSLPELYMDFQVEGEMEAPRLSVQSNLGRALERAFVKRIQEEVRKKELQLKKQIEKEMANYKQKIDQNLKDFRNKYQKEVDRLRQRWDGFLKENSKKLKL